MRAAIFLMAVLFSSCSAIDVYKTREFSFDDNEKRQRVILHIPKGFAEEKFLLGNTGGKEQYYYYLNGALLYFAKNVNWDTENQLFIDKAKAISENSRFVYKGVDKDGLHWKEIRIDDFRFGYSYVPRDHLEKFEQAINSIQFK